MKTTIISPKNSGYVDDQLFNFHDASQAVYTITIVPEPATWSLLGFGGLGAFGLTWLRARRK